MLPWPCYGKLKFSCDSIEFYKFINWFIFIIKRRYIAFSYWAKESENSTNKNSLVYQSEEGKDKLCIYNCGFWFVLYK